MTEEEWIAIWQYAGVLKANAGPGPSPGGVIGRFISVLVNKLCDFWNEHKDTLMPVLSHIAIAALEALVASRAEINLVNQEGPR